MVRPVLTVEKSTARNWEPVYSSFVNFAQEQLRAEATQQEGGIGEKVT